LEAAVSQNSLQKNQFGATIDEIQAEIDQRTWFHCFDLGHGVKTAGCDPTLRKLKALHLPQNLAGKTVIDVGAYDGFFSFECERRGAAQVVACDHCVWNAPGSDARRNIEYVKRLLNSQIEILELPVEEISPTTAGMYDVVLFLGVLYHAPDPIGYLKNIHSITKELLVLETLVDVLHLAQPAAAFYPKDSLNQDDSNHWGPNRFAVEAMLEKVGFSRVEYKGMWDVNTCQQIDYSRHRNQEKTPSLFERVRHKSDLEIRKLWSRLSPPRSGRMVFHAYP
jgi:tRNA (mo5U34)-methyltransferase